MEPTCAILFEQLVPVNVAWFHLGCCSIATIGNAFGSANTEASFREVKPIASGSSDAVVCFPLNVVRVDTSLKDEIFQQAPDLVVGKRGDDCGLHIEAASEATGYIVFAAALPGCEGSGRPCPAFARIQSKHDLA